MIVQLTELFYYSDHILDGTGRTGREGWEKLAGLQREWSRRTLNRLAPLQESIYFDALTH